MENTIVETRSAPPAHASRGAWILAAGGLALFALTWLLQGDETGFWLPGLGVGLALISWLGWRMLPALAVVLFFVRLAVNFDAGLIRVLGDTLIHIGLIGLSWWLYFHVARGSRGLDDPTSATVFLMLVPGALSAIAAVAQTALWHRGHFDPYVDTAIKLWLSRMVGILVVFPFLLVNGTPWLLKHRFVLFELPPTFFGEREAPPTRTGEHIELAALTFATSVLALWLLWAQRINPEATGMLWAICLVLIVWTCIRQGHLGGCLCASVASIIVLVAAQMIEWPPAARPAIQSNLLAFCSSALLVGVSASWIRATERRFRHVVGRIPFVVYSARLPYGLPSLVAGTPRRPDSKFDIHVGPSISKLANVLLVSPAARGIFGCEPESLVGPYSNWLDRIEEEDHIILVAALAQLCLQKQPVTCEYRLRSTERTLSGPAPSSLANTPPSRWVRDTLTPHYSDDGMVDGWEGLIEDITDQRVLSHNLRRMSNMLQVLITNLPTGVYFVQAPQGYPLLVNARARQLLGQREDLSTTLANLSRVYRLHRPDGSMYPVDELPVSKALKLGATCRANDVVVHRADGRKTPLITWAAPIDLHNRGVFDAAVWVMEDWSAMQQAEVALRESELRLRAIIETMQEGVIVQDSSGTIIECNPAASAILGIPRERLMHQEGLFPDAVGLRDDGTVLPRSEWPDQMALREHRPARDVVLGLESETGTRWLLVHAIPLPVGPSVGMNHARARVVSTFSDITQQRLVQESLRLAKDKYQKLIETLPFILIRRDANGNITYVNPAVEKATGHTPAELMAPDYCTQLLHPGDVAGYQAALDAVARGEPERVELRLRTKQGEFMTALAFFQPQIENGHFAGSISLLVDITKQKLLEQELIHAKHLELVGRLASGTVHDFNNLLAAIMGLAGIAKCEVPPDHPARQYLDRIEDVGEQAAHLAGQLLAFSKERPREHRPVDLNAAVAQTMKIIRSVMPDNIAVHAHLDPAQPLVRADENQLKQVLMNLCLNARDAMATGGQVTIRTDFTPPPHDTNGKPWAHLSISDTGHGMAESIRQRIFEPFFSTKERGTGLGLAVVHQIVTEFGGQIDVVSEPTLGTRFDVWLARA